MNGRRVLIVEDEYHIVEELVEAFEASGASIVGPVAEVGDALDLIRNGEPIDAAVLDINLQGESSYSVADALRGRGVPFVFVTGYDRSTIPRQFADIVVCEKPVEPNDIRTALFDR